MKITENQIISHMHRAYLRRLHEVIGESDVKDKRGNIVISPGLKVRHAKSGFEYTVDSVEKDPDTGQLIKIVLREPEAPRFDPVGGEKFVGEIDATQEVRPTAHDELVSQKFNLPLSEPNLDDETVFEISEEEFENEYRVNDREAK